MFFCPNVEASERSVGLPALVFVEMQLFHLLLEEGDGHGAATASLRQSVHLEDKETDGIRQIVLQK